MTAPENATSPVDHDCGPPLILVVDVDRSVVCSSCRRAWYLDENGAWREVPAWPS